MTQQETYDLCIESYRKQYNLLENIGKIYAVGSNSIDESFNLDDFLERFDIILQYSLLQIAVADYDIDINELVFIRDLTITGDLVNVINRIYNVNLSWDDIYYGNAIDVKKAIENLYSLMKDAASLFITTFALVDKVLKEVDLLKALRQGYLIIKKGLILIDGNAHINEISQKTLFEECLDLIEYLKNK